MTDDEVKRTIRMKMTQEVNTVFDEALDKEGLQELAFQTRLMEEWWELHPEKRPKTHEKLQVPTSGDFSHVQDPVKRRVLESLAQKGIKIGTTGGAAMSLDALIDMDRQMSGLPPL
jgi:hypothetical protein